MERWKGRIALVTGASVGIGEALCHRLVLDGLKVIGCARNITKLKAIGEEESVKSAPGSFTPIKCDVSKEGEILSMFEEIRHVHGRIDVCINNAGLAEVAPLMSGSTDDWRTMLDVNVFGLTICTREAIKLMQESGVSDGQIIHISSILGHKVSSSYLTFYAGTKFMVRALAEGLRQELREAKSHIRVACISPGIVETEFSHRAFRNEPGKSDSIYRRMQPLQADDVVQATVTVLQAPPHVDINDILVRPDSIFGPRLSSYE